MRWTSFAAVVALVLTMTGCASLPAPVMPALESTTVGGTTSGQAAVCIGWLAAVETLPATSVAVTLTR